MGRVPRLTGADPLQEVLEGIRTELAAARQDAAGGDAAAAGRVQLLQAQLDAALAQASSGGTATATLVRGADDGGTGDGGDGGGDTGDGGGDSELAQLRAQARRQALSAQAESIAERIVLGVRQEQQAEQAELERMVQERVRAQLQGGMVQRAVRDELAATRGGSRFAGDGASPQLLDHLAAGGSVQVQERTGGVEFEGGVRVGETRGVEYMRKNKPLGHMVRALYRAKTHTATDADHQFLRECMTKAMAEGTPSAGGVLVPIEYMPDVLGLLRALAVVRRAAPQFRNFNKQVNQLSVSSGSTAYYTPENAQGQISELTFGEAPLLTRHNLMGLVPVSNILLDDADEAERIIREDMAEVMALREDLAFLRGTGASGEPLGLRNKVGVTLDPIAPTANGFTPSIYDLRRIRARFRSSNNRNPRPVWFFNSAFITYLETLADTTGRPLLETPLLTINEDGLTGRIDGIPFFASNQIPANLTQGTSTNATDLMLVDMNTVVVGTADELEIDVSTEATYWDGTQWVSTYQNRQSLFRGWLSHDIAAQRPAQIIVQRGVLV
jgi:HK97 family phage major capsid protein